MEYLEEVKVVLRYLKSKSVTNLCEGDINVNVSELLNKLETLTNN